MRGPLSLTPRTGFVVNGVVPNRELKMENGRLCMLLQEGLEHFQFSILTFQLKWQSFPNYFQYNSAVIDHIAPHSHERRSQPITVNSRSAALTIYLPNNVDKGVPTIVNGSS